MPEYRHCRSTATLGIAMLHRAGLSRMAPSVSERSGQVGPKTAATPERAVRPLAASGRIRLLGAAQAQPQFNSPLRWGSPPLERLRTKAKNPGSVPWARVPLSARVVGFRMPRLLLARLWQSAHRVKPFGLSPSSSQPPVTLQMRCLTGRSTRQPTACRLAREAVLLIIGLAGQSSHRRLRVNSNVRLIRL